MAAHTPCCLCSTYRETSRSLHVCSVCTMALMQSELDEIASFAEKQPDTEVAKFIMKSFCGSHFNPARIKNLKLLRGEHPIEKAIANITKQKAPGKPIERRISSKPDIIDDPDESAITRKLLQGLARKCKPNLGNPVVPRDSKNSKPLWYETKAGDKKLPVPAKSNIPKWLTPKGHVDAAKGQGADIRPAAPVANKRIIPKRC